MCNTGAVNQSTSFPYYLLNGGIGMVLQMRSSNVGFSERHYSRYDAWCADCTELLLQMFVSTNEPWKYRWERKPAPTTKHHHINITVTVLL